MKKQILRWTLIGLLIRFLIMPFSFHGDDIFFIYYAPFKFIEHGEWNPYLFLKSSFPQVHNPYYPPVIFYIISIFLFLFKSFLPNLDNLFSTYESWVFTQGGNTVNYADILQGYHLFRTLFIFKIPYLIFDFGIGWLLFKILRPDDRKSLSAYKLWMLNPFVLHSCYALGQIDIIPAFFMMAAIYCIYLDRRYWTMVFLTLSALAKMFPIILVPISILLLGDTFREKIKLSLVVIILAGSMIVPFYLHSPDAISDALFFVHGGGDLFRQIFFAIGYLIILCLLFFAKRQGRINLESVISGFILVLLLFYSLYMVTIRFFILITPLLIYIALKNKRFWIYNAIFLITLFELRTGGNSQQWGLFAALQPEFFSSLPIFDSYLNLLINVKLVHQLMYRLFFVSCLTMIVHMVALSRKNLSFSPVIGAKI